MTELIINQPSFINYTSYFWIISIPPVEMNDGKSTPIFIMVTIINHKTTIIYQLYFHSLMTETLQKW